MITLNFKGPICLSKFKENQLGQNSGVYIWGFKGLLKSDKDKVIPYYVGITAEKSISETILNRHIKEIDKNESTYMRFSEEYMFEYYKGLGSYPIYPIEKSKQRKTSKLKWSGWTNEQYKEHLYYYNNKPFLNDLNCQIPIVEIHKGKNKTDFPISNIYPIKSKLQDVLINNIDKDNFWIWYAEVDKTNQDYLDFKSEIPYTPSRTKSHDLKVYEIFEAYTKFSLKGITVGKHEGDFFYLEKFLNRINITCKSDILKISISELFQGNY